MQLFLFIYFFQVEVSFGLIGSGFMICALGCLHNELIDAWLVH